MIPMWDMLPIIWETCDTLREWHASLIRMTYGTHTRHATLHAMDMFLLYEWHLAPIRDILPFIRGTYDTHTRHASLYTSDIWCPRETCYLLYEGHMTPIRDMLLFIRWKYDTHTTHVTHYTRDIWPLSECRQVILYPAAAGRLVYDCF